MNSAAFEYKLQLDEAFSAYLDSTYGFALQAKEVCNDQRKLLAERGVKNPRMNDWIDLDNQPFTYEMDGEKIYRGTVRDHKYRNDKNDRNWQWAARMFIVTAYELWDSHYRAAISREKGLSNSEAQSICLGDVRQYRNFILHCGGVADNNAAKLQKFKWVNPGERVYFSIDRIKEIVDSIQEELERY
jgi:hypothetical protein